MMEKPKEVMLFVSSSFTECAISSLVCAKRVAIMSSCRGYQTE